MREKTFLISSSVVSVGINETEVTSKMKTSHMAFPSHIFSKTPCCKAVFTEYYIISSAK